MNELRGRVEMCGRICNLLTELRNIKTHENLNNTHRYSSLVVVCRFSLEVLLYQPCLGFFKDNTVHQYVVHLPNI